MWKAGTLWGNKVGRNCREKCPEVRQVLYWREVIWKNSGEAYLEVDRFERQGGTQGVLDVCETFLMILEMRRRWTPEERREHGGQAGRAGRWGINIEELGTLRLPDEDWRPKLIEKLDHGSEGVSPKNTLGGVQRINRFKHREHRKNTQDRGGLEVTIWL